MRFCTECGTQISEQALFCKECGASLADAQAESAATISVVTAPAFSGSTVAPARMSRKQKVFLLSGVVLLAVLFGGYKVGEYYTSEDRLIGRFEQALDSQDPKAIAKLLSSTDENLVIDEKSITGFVSYLDQNPEHKQDILGTLKEQVALGEQAAKDNSLDQLLQGFGLNGIVNLEKSGKMLFYDTYSLTMDAVYISVETNFAGTVLSVNGQQAAVADTPNFATKLGPYVPGLYQVEARFKNEFIDLKNVEDMELLDAKTSYAAYLELEGQTVRWDTRFSEQPELNGRLYINGKKVEVNPFDNPEFGPVTTDGSMTLAVEADFPWGTVKSAEAKIDKKFIVLDFTRQDNVQKSIKDTVVKHAKENLDAFASGDMDKLTISTDKYKNVLQSVVSQFKESGYAYKSKYIGTVFDMGSMDLDLRNGVWQMTMVTQPLIEAATFVEGESPSLEMQEAFSFTGLVYDEDQGIWKVDFISNTWGFKTDELEENKEEKPVTYESTWKETETENTDSKAI